MMEENYAIQDSSKWFLEHQQLASTRGAEIDLLVMPQEAEASMVASLMQIAVKAEVCHMVEKKDNTVRLYLNGVPIKFSTKLPGNIAWFRFKGGRSG